VTVPGRTSLPSGLRLGPYEILAPLGAGGMGDVYRARDTRLGREVALKTLPPEFASDPERLSRFDLEARAVGALNDPHVVTIYDVGVHEGTPFVVFELVEGDTLRKRLEQGALPVASALDIATQVARGLATAHERGIVHRDLKPENIVVGRGGRVKILDFGLAKRLTGENERAHATATIGAALTSPGSMYGTVGYMAPEQLREQPVDGRTDLFALGAILYEMLTGHRAFQGATPADVQSAILSAEPEALPEAVRRTAPAGLERVVRRMLEKDPVARPQHARDLAFDLELLETTNPLGAAAGPSSAAGSRNRAVLVGAGLLALVGIAALAWSLTHARPGVERVRYHRMTFRNGIVHNARFTPDGHSIIYSAEWDGESTGVYTAQAGSPETRSLGYRDAALLAVSSGGDLGIVVHSRFRPHLIRRGTLARVPLAGGAPRAIVDSVEAADWAHDGTLAVLVGGAEGRYRLECPPGRVLRETSGWMSRPRFSPDGDRIAFFDHQIFPDDRGTLMVADRTGKVKVLASGFESCQGLAWRPDGKEVWFSAARTGIGAGIYAATLSGAIRTVAESPGGMRITDIAPDGRVLFVRDNQRAELFALSPGAKEERDLTWGDWSVLADLSDDGRTVLFTEEGDAVAGAYAVCIRGTDGSPVVKLGEGAAFGLSPDGRYALASTVDAPTVLMLFPTGAGEAKTLPRGPIRTHYQATWLPDGHRVFSIAEDTTGAVGGYIQDIGGGVPTRVLQGTDFTAGGVRVTRDGGHVAVSPIRRLYSLTGAPAKDIPGIAPGERFFCAGFSSDGREIFAAPIGSLRPTPLAIDLETGARRAIGTITPRNPAGILNANFVRVAGDGKSYVYMVNRNLSDIYIAEGLR
jgi:Tol biopolymer transport system component